MLELKHRWVVHDSSNNENSGQQRKQKIDRTRSLWVGEKIRNHQRVHRAKEKITIVARLMKIGQQREGNGAKKQKQRRREAHLGQAGGRPAAADEQQKLENQPEKESGARNAPGADAAALT